MRDRRNQTDTKNCIAGRVSLLSSSSATVAAINQKESCAFYIATVSLTYGSRSESIAPELLHGYRYKSLLAIHTQGGKDNSLKQQPQAVVPSLAGII